MHNTEQCDILEALKQQVQALMQHTLCHEESCRESVIKQKQKSRKSLRIYCSLFSMANSTKNL